MSAPNYQSGSARRKCCVNPVCRSTKSTCITATGRCGATLPWCPPFGRRRRFSNSRSPCTRRRKAKREQVLCWPHFAPAANLSGCRLQAWHAGEAQATVLGKATWRAKSLRRGRRGVWGNAATEGAQARGAQRDRGDDHPKCRHRFTCFHQSGHWQVHSFPVNSRRVKTVWLSAGQTGAKVSLEKNPGVFLDPKQPLVQAVNVSDEDIKRQEDRVALVRKKLQEALKE